MPRKPANKLNENEEVSKKKSTGSISENSAKKTKTTTKAKKNTSEASAKKSTKAQLKEESISVSKVSVDTTSEKKAIKVEKNSARSTSKKATNAVSEVSSKKKTSAKSKTSSEKVTGTKSKASSKKTSGSVSKASSEKMTGTKLKASAKKTAGTKSKASATKAKRATRAKKSTLADINPDEITSSTNLTEKIKILEYYDLPYRYNQTVVKILAQTPTTLFIYWDISDKDRENFVKKYGPDFFNNTKPVLIIHNKTMNYSFEIEIDDFANSWYLHVNDSNCEYFVELGRKPKYNNSEPQINIPNNYLYVSSSNKIDSPNDHVLFDKDLKTVYFKDVKTNIVTAKDVCSISFLRNICRIYNLYDLYSDFTKDSWINGNHLQLDLKNPSSSSSTFK